MANTDAFVSDDLIPITLQQIPIIIYVFLLLENRFGYL